MNLNRLLDKTEQSNVIDQIYLQLYRYDFNDKRETPIKKIKLIEGQDIDIGYNVQFS